jgi:hypothetical protein
MYTFKLPNHLLIISFFFMRKFDYRRTTILRAFSTPFVQCIIISIDKLPNK